MPKKKPVQVWSTTFPITGTVRHVSFHVDGEILDYINAFRDHLVIDPKDAPKYLFPRLIGLTEREKGDLPDLMIIKGGVYLMSEAMNDLLSDFDLGPTQIFERPYFEDDQITRRPGRWFILHITSVKDTIVAKALENVEQVGKSDKFRPRGTVEPEYVKIVLNTEALRGADLWFEDRMHQRLFLSDRLKSALKTNKMRVRRMPFFPCEIVDPA